MPRLIIDEIATKQGLNQAQLQIKAGVSPALLNRYWRNTAEKITLAELGKIAHTLGVAPGDLIVDDEFPQTTEHTSNAAPHTAPTDRAQRFAELEHHMQALQQLVEDQASLHLNSLRELWSQIETMHLQIQNMQIQSDANTDQLHVLQQERQERQERATKSKARSATTGGGATAPADLPEGLVSWRQFADLHHASRNTTAQFISQGFIHAIRGKWQDGQGTLKEALDTQGRRDFWVQLHQTDGFLSCEDCPHNG
jgi:transcriptional regulator with XRE-family HTH domain